MSESRDEATTVEADPVEIEWQFDALDLRPVERWLATLPTLAVETGDGGTVTALAQTPRRLVDSYLDTDDWRIARAGFVARTRHRGRHEEVTMKDMHPAQGSGLRQRLEVTEVLPPDGVGALGPEGPVGRRLRAIVGARRLREVLQVRTRRRPFALRVGGVDVAEVALDETVIVVGGGQRPMQLRRVEVEVQAEWVEALEPIVQQLRISCGLQPARLSKFEAGLLAVGLEIPGSPDLGPTDISPTSSMGELAFAVVRRQLAVLRAKEPGTRLGEDPEELHDMRVATRRLRAALSLFADVFPVRAQAFREELGWLGRTLGAVRDLDVQLAGLDDMATATAGWSDGVRADGHDPLADLSELSRREWEAARVHMLAALDSVRWERLAKGLAAMAQQGPPRRSVATRVPAVIGLPELIVSAPRRRGQGHQAGQEVGGRRRLPPPAHPLQAPALHPRVRLQGLRGAHRSLRPPARRLQDELGAHAGRRGGVAAPGRAGDGGDAAAGGHRLCDGRRGGAPSPRRRAPPAPAAQRAHTVAGESGRAAPSSRSSGPRPRPRCPPSGARCGPCRLRPARPASPESTGSSPETPERGGPPGRRAGGPPHRPPPPSGQRE